jgi:glycosyltransferase involved in cell wall biosynthesis
VSWIGYHGRSADLAASLGLDCRFNPAWFDRVPAPLRYLASTVLTLWRLIRDNPQVVVVMSPPPFAVLAAWPYVALTRRPLYVDAHSGVFTHPLWRRFVPALRWATNHHGAVLVTNSEAARSATDAGFATVIELHDVISARTSVEIDAAPCVLVVASWREDEPMIEVAGAAAALPEVIFRVSGRPTGPSVSALSSLANVVLLGFVSRDQYETELAGATIVLALTTRESTMQRGGYEAMSWGRALLTSDTAVLREFFADGAMFTKPDAGSIAAALPIALAAAPQLRAAIIARRDVLAEQQRHQLALFESDIRSRVA